MKDTIVYLIRHAETIEENGISNTNEDFQMINENEILDLEYKGNKLDITSPCLLKMIFRKGELVNLEQILDI